MSAPRELQLRDADATVAFGAALAPLLRAGDVIFLRGELGAGKTTLARGLIQALLPGARVRSPTYTLVEPYATPYFELLHLDLYRLASADELDALGVRERTGEAVLLVEWPERALSALPSPSLVIELAHCDDRRSLRLSAAAGELETRWSNVAGAP